ncbi:unnamed protein product [Urochloa humidicola]
MMSPQKHHALRSALADEQNRDEGGRFVPGKKPPGTGKKMAVKKPGAGKKMAVKKPGAGKKPPAVLPPPPRASPPRLHHGNASPSSSPSSMEKGKAAAMEKGKAAATGKKMAVKKKATEKGKEKATEKKKGTEKKRKSMATEKDHMSFWDLHNAVAASQVKINVFEEELAKEKARKKGGAGAQVKINVLKDELAKEKDRKNEFHRALINASKKARNI